MVGYSIDLTSISVDEFAETLLTVELLPSRRALADHIATILPKLGETGIENLGQLRRLLANKRKYPELAARLGVDTDYVALLNREVNSYVSKPVLLAKLDCLTPAEIEELAAAGIRSSKDLYGSAATPAQRGALGVADERLLECLRLVNLVRINGVGPAFARFLADGGIAGPKDFLSQNLQQLVADYAASVGDNAPNLRIEDLEYVQRYCRGLSEDIEW